jgi:diamine N-acetyltransferase
MVHTMTVEIRTISRENIGEVVGIEVSAAQSSYVAPVVASLAEAYVQPDVAWPRAVYDMSVPVGFVMGAFEPDAEQDFFRCGIWRLNIAADRQGKGYGRFAVDAVLDEAVRRGQTRATVLWVPGENGPENFWKKLGFSPTGEDFYGQVVAERFLEN